MNSETDGIWARTIETEPGDQSEWLVDLSLSTHKLSLESEDYYGHPSEIDLAWLPSGAFFTTEKLPVGMMSPVEQISWNNC